MAGTPPEAPPRPDWDDFRPCTLACGLHSGSAATLASGPPSGSATTLAAPSLGPCPRLILVSAGAAPLHSASQPGSWVGARGFRAVTPQTARTSSSCRCRASCLHSQGAMAPCNRTPTYKRPWGEPIPAWHTEPHIRVSPP